MGGAADGFLIELMLYVYSTIATELTTWFTLANLQVVEFPFVLLTQHNWS